MSIIMADTLTSAGNAGPDATISITGGGTLNAWNFGDGWMTFSATGVPVRTRVEAYFSVGFSLNDTLDPEDVITVTLTVDGQDQEYPYTRGQLIEEWQVDDLPVGKNEGKIANVTATGKVAVTGLASGEKWMLRELAIGRETPTVSLPWAIPKVNPTTQPYTITLPSNATGNRSIDLTGSRTGDALQVALPITFAQSIPGSVSSYASFSLPSQIGATSNSFPASLELYNVQNIMQGQHEITLEVLNGLSNSYFETNSSMHSVIIVDKQ